MLKNIINYLKCDYNKIEVILYIGIFKCLLLFVWGFKNLYLYLQYS